MASIVPQTPFNEYTGNGVATVYGFEFQLFEAADFEAKLDGVVVPSSDYTLSGLGVQAGGTCTFDTAPASGAAVLLSLKIALSRDTDYQENGDLLASTLDRDFNRLWQRTQIADAEIGGALRLPYPEQATELPAVADRGGKLLSFNSSTGAPEVVAPVEGTATALALQLADPTGASNGPGMVAFNGALPYNGGSDDWLGGLLYTAFGRTAGEITANVTPVNYAYQVGHLERYVHNTTPGTTDMTAAFDAAYRSTGGGGGAVIYAGKKVYAHTGITFDGAINLKIIGESNNNLLNAGAGGYYANATVLLYTGTASSVGVVFVGSSYTSGGLSIENVVFAASASTYVVTFTGCAQVDLINCMVTNNSASSTAHGARFSACTTTHLIRSMVTKGENIMPGSSTGITVDMGARSDWLGGIITLENSGALNYQTGMVVGDGNPSAANENYANVNIINSELSLNEVGLALQHGVKSAKITGSYIEGNVQRGIFVALGARNVSIDTNFFNNATAGAGDVTFGVGGGNTQYQEFYNCEVVNNTFLNVKTAGVAVSAVTGSFVDIKNNHFTAVDAASVGVTTNIQAARQSDNTFVGFTAGQLATGPFAPSISTRGGSFTVTATGFSGSVTGVAYYEKHGNMATLLMPGLSGTSDATTFTITGLPSDMTPTRNQGATNVYVVDNGGAPTVVGVAQLLSTGVIALHPTAAFGAWTASGTKAVGTFNYNYVLI